MSWESRGAGHLHRPVAWAGDIWTSEGLIVLWLCGCGARFSDTLADGTSLRLMPDGALVDGVGRVRATTTLLDQPR